MSLFSQTAFTRVILPVLSLTFLIASCNAVKKGADLKALNQAANDRSLVMTGYQPIDPIQIHINKDTDTIIFSQFITVFPNEATRLAIGEIGQTGTVSFGPAGLAMAGKSYSVILDYIKYTTSNLPVLYKEGTDKVIVGDSVFIGTDQAIKTDFGSVMSRSFKYIGKQSNLPTDISQNENDIKLPVYIGIGLRIQASITVFSDSVNLSSLYSIGLAASQKKLTGTLIIQTLGISGENISPLMPMPDQINESTIQIAMQALATIKSKLYDRDKIIISPQVVAFKLPFAINGAKDLIESTLHSNPPSIDISKKGKVTIIAPKLK